MIVAAVTGMRPVADTSPSVSRPSSLSPEGSWAMIAAPAVIHAKVLETVVQVLQDEDGGGHRL